MALSTDSALIQRRTAQWNAHPPLAASLPVVLPGGGTVDGFEGHCASCADPIPAIQLHGTAILVLPTVVAISAVGYCRTCECLTEYQHRVRAVDGSLQSEWIGPEGRWIRRAFVREPKPGSLGALVRRLVSWIRQRGP
jgi:hypothetical protein